MKFFSYQGLLIFFFPPRSRMLHIKYWLLIVHTCLTWLLIYCKSLRKGGLKVISQANHYCAQCWKCLSRPEMCSVWTDRNIKSRCRQTWKRVTNTGTASILCWYSYWSASLILGDFTVYYASGSELSSEMLSVQDKCKYKLSGWVCLYCCEHGICCMP